jgi:DNA topoisomerase-1
MKGKPLLVVESPTKAKTITRYLGGDFEVMATIGHLRDLPKNKMGVKMDEDFELDYVIDPEKKKIVDQIVRAAKGTDKVLLATDPDREGEAISWHVNWILQNAKSRSTKSQIPNPNEILNSNNQFPKEKIVRVTFHEITKEAIEEALRHPREIDLDLVNAQQGRRVLDRVVGYSLSPVLWKKVRKGLSAGRVQSVAVRLICEREKEINSFAKEKFYKIFANLNKAGNEFGGELVKIDGESFVKSKKIELFDGAYTYTKSMFSRQEEAEEFIKSLGKEFEVTKVTARETSRTPLPAFSTSKLQQAAAR